MNMIFRMGKLELRTLFYSPIAWLLLVIFTIHSGYAVVHILGRFVSPDAFHNMNDLTDMVFASRAYPPGVFITVEQSLYLYVPLLTMGLLSREFSSGSIKLLLSSPVRASGIILGKFLAIMTYWLILMLILLLVAVAADLSIVSMDWGLVLSGMLGIYLLASAYSALGLFMSSLTPYQVVAALSTLITLAMLNFMSGMWQDIPVLRDIVWFLNLNMHVKPMIEGLIVSNDVLYFVIMTILFIGMAIFRLQDSLSSKAVAMKTGRYALLTGTLLLMGYFFSRQGFVAYYDATGAQSNTLTKGSREILEKIKAPVKITAYVNLLDADVYVGMPANRNPDRAFWSRYIRFIPGLQLDYVNYYDTVANDYIFKNKVYAGKTLRQIAEEVADGRDWDINDHLPPEEIHKIIDLSGEENLMVRQVEYNGHKAFLRKFDDMIHDPGEQEITTAFRRLITGPSKIAFVTGHNERDIHKKGDRDYKLLTNTLSYRNSLINQGFDAQSVTLDKEIPGDISALVIAGPTTPYSGEELRKIQHYIAAGGNVMICGDAGVQAVLNPVTGPLGVRFTDGTLMRDNKDAAQDYVLAGFTPAVQKYPDSYAGEYKGGRKVLMEGAAGLTYKNGDGFFADTLLMADTSGTWIKAGEFRLDTGKIRYDPARGDTKGAACVALALTRERAGKQQRIIILGDADFMSNADLRKDVLGPAANYGFAYDIFQWFSYGVYPIALPRPNGADNKLLMTEGGLIWFKIIFFGVIPGLLLLSGTVLLITRNRK